MSAVDGSLSLWLDQVAGSEADPRRPALESDIDADVAIVGAGYTGLWTAYYLAKADPSLRIVVLEREFAGFGASGRNGGWCSSLFPSSLGKVTKIGGGRERAIALQHALNETVDEVGRVVAEEGIDCHFAKGGTVVLARTRIQLERAKASVQEERSYGFGEEDVRLLSASEASSMVGATNVLGGTFTPHCAAIQPAMLARGLAEAVERLGVTIHERTTVAAIRDGVVETANGSRVRAGKVVRATEGYTPSISGFRRDVAPVYSLMVATEPLPEEVWQQIGLAGRQTFADFRHLIVYGQRTADGRLVFGGRGAPYHYASRIAAGYDRVPAVFAELEQAVHELFPVLRGTVITHRWGGPLGIARDWHASVGLDRTTGLAWAGGYVGDGVSTTNLAGRTLADLITGRDTELTRLPWVGHRSRRWEPEPLRWLGANAGLRAMTWADAAERRHGRPSRMAALVTAMMGR